jgi:hypothetical protein
MHRFSGYHGKLSGQYFFERANAVSLEASSVNLNLRVFYWVNVREHSWEKVRSSVLPEMRNGGKGF